MKSSILSITILFVWIQAVSQPDTMIYKRQIEHLSDKVSKQIYLDSLFKRDQQYRGNDAITLFDLENLISISYYVNTYGYPLEDDFGESSNTPQLIWIHNSFHGLRRLSFPLIYKAFQSGQISESKLRSYYLRTMYVELYDDEKINEIPLPALYDMLDLNTSNAISIKALISYMEDKRKFNSLPKKEVLKWHAAEKSKWITANGERKWITYKTSPVEIITLENCKIYFRKVLVDHSYEPQELQKFGEKKYRFKDRQSDKYFEIDADGNLLYRSEKEVIDLYKKQV